MTSTFEEIKNQIQLLNPNNGALPNIKMINILDNLNERINEVEILLRKIDKDMVEGFIANRIVERMGDNIPVTMDNPFDAIYLAELQPDKINPVDVQVLNKFKNIIDLSDTIHFNDEWED